MRALCRVEGSERLDGAPAKGRVAHVSMFERPDIRSEIEGGRGENGFVEDSPQVGESLADFCVVVDVAGV